MGFLVGLMSPATFFRVHNYFPRCVAAEAVVEHIAAAAAPGHPPPPSSSSVTSQPTPRADLFPASATDDSCSSPADSPSASPPETEQSSPPPAEDDEETQGPSQPKHRTLLDIDRFTLCGNRID